MSVLVQNDRKLKKNMTKIEHKKRLKIDNNRANIEEIKKIYIGLKVHDLSYLTIVDIDLQFILLLPRSPC